MTTMRASETVETATTRLYAPRPPLSQFVEFFWFDAGARPAHARERVLPTGTMDLIVSLDRDTLRVFDRTDTDRAEHFRDAVICGAHAEYFVIDGAERAATVGVHFQPGGAAPLLGLPASELSARHVALDALWGRSAAELRARLLEARGAEQAFRVLERLLLARLERVARRHPAVAFALRALADAPHARGIAEVVEQVGLSPRRFIQVFEDAVGLTPKLFCRVRRFQEALHRINQGDDIAWCDVAAGCGYFDQSHFIRDFRAFSGLTPSAYVARRSEHANHVRLDD